MCSVHRIVSLALLAWLSAVPLAYAQKPSQQERPLQLSYALSRGIAEALPRDNGGLADQLYAQQLDMPASQASSKVCAWQLTANKGTLRQELEKWALDAGWQPVWELPTDFPVELGATFCGGFESAIESVLKSYAMSGTPIRGLFYSGNKVLRFVTGGR